MQQTKERATAQTSPRGARYATLLVHAEPGLAASHRVEVAGRLARDLDARLIGLGAETFDPTPTPDPFSGYAAGEWVVLVQEQIARDLAAAEVAFRRDAGGADLEWRSMQDYPHKALVRMAHAADLIVTSPRGPLGPTRSADPADVMMGAGRPVLVVPEGKTRLQAKAVVVAWKNTRECRRALGDAMPFLQGAEDVIILAIVRPDAEEMAVAETADVVANLKRHGVAARALVTTLAHDAVSEEIQRTANMNNADLIVCGAFGHSRLREWAFGGVTDDFLHRPASFVLMSH